MKKMLSEFRDFAIKGNVVDLAVGIIIGAAFTGIVNSLVNDVLMPPLGWLMGGVDFSNIFISLPAKEALLNSTLNGTAPIMPHYETLDAAKKAGVTTIAVGVFINAIINFLIVAFAIFMLVKQVNKLKKKQEAAPAAPAAPPADVVLLTEIRDLLKAKG